MMSGLQILDAVYHGREMGVELRELDVDDRPEAWLPFLEGVKAELPPDVYAAVTGALATKALREHERAKGLG